MEFGQLQQSTIE